MAQTSHAASQAWQLANPLASRISPFSLGVAILALAGACVGLIVLIVLWRRDALPGGSPVLEPHVAKRSAPARASEELEASVPTRPSAVERPGHEATEQSLPAVDTDDTRYCHVVAATYGGVGLVGAGAEAAARAALSLFIANQHAAVANNTVITTKGLLRRLGGDALTYTRIPKLQLCDDEEHLRKAVAAEFLTRMDKPKPDRPLVVFTESSTKDDEFRSVLDRGRHYGIGGVIVGDWPRHFVVSAEGHLSFGGPVQCGVLDENTFNANLATLARAAAVGKSVQTQRDGRDGAAEGPAPRRVLHRSSALVRRPRGTHDTRLAEPQLWLKLLGGIEMRFCGEPVRFSRVKTYELLALLGSQSGGCERELLFSRLLPEAEPGDACAGLTKIVSSTRSDLRQLTGHLDEVFVRRVDERWELDSTWIGTDLEVFNRSLAAAKTAAELDERASHLKQVVGSYEGPFAAGLLAGTSWMEGLRARCQAAAHDACMSLAEYYERQGNLFAAVDVLERATDVDPEVEASYTRLIDLYQLRNDRSGVARAERRLKELR